MTTGVVAMNREAVAVAADCTLTTFTVDGQKHLRAVDKMFTLTVDPPAVLMVYGRLDLAGVPWQTLAAEFKRGGSFAAGLPDLAHEFLAFIQCTYLVPEEALVAGWLRCLTAVFEETFHLDVSDWRRLPYPGRRDRRFIRGLAEVVASFADGDWLDGVDGETVKAQLARNDDVYEEVLADLPATRPELVAMRRLLKIAMALATTRCRTGGHASGLVIAGFGRRDAFPAVVEVPCVTIERDRVRASRPTYLPVTIDHPADLRSYAQDEEVEAFLTGVNPDLEEALDREWEDSLLFLRAMERAVADVIGHLPSSACEAVEALNAHRSRATQLLDRLRAERAAYTRSRLELGLRHFRWPVVQGMQHLPARELGSLAESMVARAGWRHRVAVNQTESVGDTVKVAVLSRSEGIEWSRASAVHRTSLLPAT